MNWKNIISDFQLLFLSVILVPSWNKIFSGEIISFFTGISGLLFCIIMVILRDCNGVKDGN